MDSALSKARAGSTKDNERYSTVPQSTCILNYAERDRKIVGSQIGLNKALVKKQTNILIGISGQYI